MVRRPLSYVVFAALSVLACSAVPDGPSKHDAPVSEPRDLADAAVATATAERVEIVGGVPNRGRDPAVVAIDIGGEGLCSGTLISPRLVLTARHCVSRTAPAVSCPASGVQIFETRRASDLSILAGEDIASARLVGRGLAVLAPGGVTLCDGDIAVIVLEEAVALFKPLAVGSRGPAVGDHVRAVGFGRPGDDDPAGRKLLREHVRVRSVSAAEFTVGEATCQGDSGGPALDEDTGEVLGVVSRGGPQCEGPGVYNVYTRVDAFSWLIEEAFVRAAELDSDLPPDAGAPAKPAKRGSKQRPPSDVGGPCVRAADCAAGVCITEPLPSGETRSYCSRPCGPGDRCPTRYHCKPLPGLEAGSSACVNVR